MKKLTALIILSSALLTSCGSSEADKEIKGNNQLTTENRNTTAFEGVSSQGNFEVYLAAGSPASVKIEAESNILPHIETYVEENMLKIRAKDSMWLRPQRHIKIFVTAPRFKKIHSAGSERIIGQTPIADSSKLDISIIGNGSIKLDVDAPEVMAQLAGNGGIELKGQSRIFDCKLGGNGSLKAFNLLAEETKVVNLGNGDAEVYASVKLDILLIGNGDVRYKGNAQPVTDDNGTGSISRVN